MTCERSKRQVGFYMKPSVLHTGRSMEFFRELKSKWQNVPDVEK